MLGPNGAGKTTTLRMVAGLLQPDQGEALIAGHSIIHSPQAAKRHLAYLPDEPLLYGKLRALEYLEFVAGLWGIDPSQAETDATRLLQMLGLWEVRRDFCETYSRGMKQKLALIAAFIHRPTVIVLDEPLTGLDAAAARLVKDMLVSALASLSLSGEQAPDLLRSSPTRREPMQGMKLLAILLPAWVLLAVVVLGSIWRGWTWHLVLWVSLGSTTTGALLGLWNVRPRSSGQLAQQQAQAGDLILTLLSFVSPYVWAGAAILDLWSSVGAIILPMLLGSAILICGYLRSRQLGTTFGL